MIFNHQTESNIRVIIQFNMIYVWFWKSNFYANLKWFWTHFNPEKTENWLKSIFNWLLVFYLMLNQNGHFWIHPIGWTIQKDLNPLHLDELNRFTVTIRPSLLCSYSLFPFKLNSRCTDFLLPALNKFYTKCTCQHVLYEHLGYVRVFLYNLVQLFIVNTILGVLHCIPAQ